VTVRDYGDQIVETSWGLVIPAAEGKTLRGKSKQREKNIERADRRARANVRRKALAAGIDHLLTLTYRYNETDKWKTWDHFERFIRLVHEVYPDWVYIAVPEQQRRGAYHFHVGIKGYQDLELLRSLWHKAGSYGNIDVQYRKGKTGAQWQRVKLAQYLVKYRGKEMETDLNERRFRASLGIELPSRVFYVPVSVPIKEYALWSLEVLGGQVGHVWDEGRGYGCKGGRALGGKVDSSKGHL
jgi:hypothetical protein